MNEIHNYIELGSLSATTAHAVVNYITKVRFGSESSGPEPEPNQIESEEDSV